jgi:hypothetical protein
VCEPLQGIAPCGDATCVLRAVLGLHALKLDQSAQANPGKQARDQAAQQESNGSSRQEEPGEEYECRIDK